MTASERSPWGTRGARDVRVRDEGVAHETREPPNLVLPWQRRVDCVDVDLADHPVDEQVDELVLVPDVRVEGGAARPELLRDPADRDRVQAVRVENPQRGIDDGSAVERARAAPTDEPARPLWRLRQVGHCLTV
jgi:hypothetical protein